jgi:hypothetical protein
VWPEGVRKCGVIPRIHAQDSTIMEIERINLIGTQLNGLTARTQELRGYL